MTVSDELAKWLEQEESSAQRKLADVDLVIESNFSESDIHRLRTFYGAAVARLRAEGMKPSELIAKFPALTLTILVGHAALSYDSGRYWESFWIDMGQERKQVFENELRSSVNRLVEGFGLRSVASIQPVQMLGMHAGLPSHCMSDVVGVVVEHLRRGRRATGSAVFEWLWAPGKEYRQNSLDKPVRNFFHYGGEFALDVLDAFVRAIDGSFSGERVDQVRDNLLAKVPRILADGMAAALWKFSEGGAESETEVLTFASETPPRLLFDSLENQVIVALPRRRQDELWSVSVDGRVHDVVVVEQMFDEVGPHEEALPGPFEQIGIEDASSERTWVRTAVSRADPLLLFDGGSGSWIANQSSVPKGEVYALLPVGAVLEDAVSQTELSPYLELGAVHRWPAWRAALFDLSRCTSLQVVDGVHRGLLRGVRSVEVPTLIYRDRIVGLTTSSGMAVYGRRPMIELPRRDEVSEQGWEIRVRNANDDNVAVLRLGSAIAHPVDPFEKLGVQLFGMFEVLVSGPSGVSLQYPVFLLEGVQVSHSAWIRVPESKQGAGSCKTLISCSGALSADHDSVEFDVGKMSKVVEFRGARLAIRLVLTPPHASSYFGQRGDVVRWRSSVAKLEAESLDEVPNLMLNLPGCTAVRVELQADGQSTKWYVPRINSEGVCTVDLRVFTDAARRVLWSQLTAVLVNTTGQIQRFVIAEIGDPPAEDSSVSIDGKFLVFGGFRRQDGRAARLWWETAPWQPPEVVLIDSDRIELPRAFVEAGPIRFETFVRDPSSSESTPVAPGGRAVVVEQSGWRRDHNKGRERLSRYLVEGGRPPMGASTLPDIWSILIRQADHLDNVRESQMYRELVRVLLASPRLALEALPSGHVLRGDVVASLIRSELVRRHFRELSAQSSGGGSSWVRCLVALAGVTGGAGGDAATASRAALRSSGGPELEGLVFRGEAITLHGDELDSAVDELVEHSTAELGLLHVDLRLLNKHIGSYSARWSSVLSAVTMSNDQFAVNKIVRLMAEVKYLAGEIEFFASVPHMALMERIAIFERLPKPRFNWFAAAVYSFAAACLCRLEAHDLGDNLATPGVLEQWAEIAQMCPELVVGDLVIADALVVNNIYGEISVDH